MRRSIVAGALAVLAASVAIAADSEIETASSTGRVLFVANNGTDSLNCGSYAIPCRTISRAIENAVDGDQIMVGPGLYGDLNGDVQLDDPGEESPPPFGHPAVVLVYKRLSIYSQQGAAATTIRFSPLVHLGGLTRIVDITHDDVAFGRPNGGFTILGGADTYGITSEASRARVVGNIALNNDLGFSVSSDEQTTIRENKFVGNVAVVPRGGSGFTAGAKTINTVFDGDIAIGPGSGDSWGFRLEGSGHTVRNCRASGNGVGIIVTADGSNNTFFRNSVIGNLGPGFLFLNENSNVLRRNNIFGNSTGNTPPNCGVENHSRFDVDAAGNYWGAPSGPGPDPADNAGPGCDTSIGHTFTTPFATKAFPIN